MIMNAKKHIKGKLFVASLSLGKPYENIANSNNMKVLRNVCSLETGINQDVVISKITEDYWHTVIEQTKKYRICTLGAPGIGKTTTTSILIRLLLEQSMTVVYHVRTCNKDGWIYIFEPSSYSDTIEVNVIVIREKSFQLQMIEYQFSDILSTYYVVDPGLTKDNCNPPVDFKGKVIIVASPNEGHWGSSSFTKCKGDIRGIFLYYPMWTLQELIEAREVFTGIETNISENEIKERFFQFGGVPAYIFSKSIDFDKTRQMNALNMLLFNTQALSLAFKTRSGVTFSSDTLPRDILVSYILEDDDKRNNKYTFENRVAVLSSDFIYEFVAKKLIRELWLQKALYKESFDGKLFEAYTRQLFYDSVQPNIFHATVRVLTQPEPLKLIYQKRISDSTKTNKVPETTTICLGGCSKLVIDDNVVEAAILTPMVLFYPISQTNAMIDFIYRKDNVYHIFQSTLSKVYTANPEHIFALVRDVVHQTKKENETTNDTRNNEWNGLPLFNFYYIVPSFQFDEFVTTPVNVKQSTREVCEQQNDEELLLHWDDIVFFYALRIDQPQE
jgi:hypothetical protein